MVGKKITKSQIDRMIEMRENGATYKQIMREVGVSNWACNNYLRDIETKRGFLETEWKKAEGEAHKILEKKGFENIINLNTICPTSYWDYYATFKRQKWLVDVTINEQKSVIDKIFRRIEGFNHAILLKKDNNWEMIHVKLEKI